MCLWRCITLVPGIFQMYRKKRKKSTNGRSNILMSAVMDIIIYMISGTPSLISQPGNRTVVEELGTFLLSSYWLSCKISLIHSDWKTKSRKIHGKTRILWATKNIPLYYDIFRFLFQPSIIEYGSTFHLVDCLH